MCIRDRFTSVTYSNVYFREPESRADQTRMMSIVTTGPDTGYYVCLLYTSTMADFPYFPTIGTNVCIYPQSGCATYTDSVHRLVPVSYTHLDVYKRQII